MHAPHALSKRSRLTKAAPAARNAVSDRRAWPSCDLLRTLTLRAGEHPRGQGHLSAASGLVCANGLIYVIADDEHHLGVFTDLHSPGRLHRLLPGDLPAAAAERKRRKADFETLAALPAWEQVEKAGQGGVLLALGSGSAPGRDGAVLIALAAEGGPAGAPQRLDLAPLYNALRAHAGAINIEGAVVVGDELVLFNRGGSGARGVNALVRCALRPLLGEASAFVHQAVRTHSSVKAANSTNSANTLNGANAADAAKAAKAADRANAVPAAKALVPSTPTYPSVPSFTWQPCDLGAVQGVGYGFTDAAALANGSFLFTAVAEDSADSVADGACVGSAIGLLSAAGRLQWLRPLRGSPKVEGIAVNETAAGIDVCLVTDADDPLLASQLLRLHLPRRSMRGLP